MQLDELAARQAITDTLYRYARAIDRMDSELLARCYFDDATDEHLPFFRGNARAYIEWVMPALAGMVSARHDISNIFIDWQGEAAGVESYWQARLRVRAGEGLQDVLRGGRYIDRFEKRADEWRIAHRISVPEFSQIIAVAADQSMSITGLSNEAAEPAQIARDRSDLSYQFMKTSL